MMTAEAAKQVETGIAEGRLEENVWEDVRIGVAMNMGHFCMMLHTMVRYPTCQSRLLR